MILIVSRRGEPPYVEGGQPTTGESSAWWSSGLVPYEAEAVNPLVDGSSPSGGAIYILLDKLSTLTSAF